MRTSKLCVHERDYHSSQQNGTTNIVLSVIGRGWVHSLFIVRRWTDAGTVHLHPSNKQCSLVSNIDYRMYWLQSNKNILLYRKVSKFNSSQFLNLHTIPPFTWAQYHSSYGVCSVETKQFGRAASGGYHGDQRSHCLSRLCLCFGCPHDQVRPMREVWCAWCLCILPSDS